MTCSRDLAKPVPATDALRAQFARLTVAMDVSSPDACWLWPASVDTHGYGQIMHQGKRHGAHRVAFVLAGKDLPGGYSVCHHCDTPRCVNPSHLFAGTHQENVRDCRQKGRAYKQLPGPKPIRQKRPTASDLNRLKTHCPKGHPYSGHNLIRYDGSRRCRVCVSARIKRWKLLHRTPYEEAS